MEQNMKHHQENKNTWNNPRFLPNNAYQQHEKKRQSSHDRQNSQGLEQDTVNSRMSTYLKKQKPHCVTNATE